MKSRSKFTVFVALLSLMVFSACSFTIPRLSQMNLSSSSAPAAEVQAAVAAPAPVVVAGDGTALEAYQGTLTAIYQVVNPSVVNIRVVQLASNSGPGQDSSTPSGEALGSGFVYDAEGHIVTNYHVVEGADKIEVTFSDGTVVPAEVVGSDPDSDLAVIKVDLPAGITPLTMGDSTKVEVGQLAIAIGNPYGLSGTMTAGIISAVGRSIPASETANGSSYSIPDVIQTDAPINPGNSGGVLLNAEGQVIGVPSAIRSDSGANSGIGFAIPSATIEQVVPKLIAGGKVEHPWLGISGGSLTSDMVATLGLPEGTQGVLVASVLPDSPAEKAGLIAADVQGEQAKAGDVITAVDGQKIIAMDELIAYLAKSKVGQQLELSVLRDGKTIQVSVELAARPAQ
jgi:S1-C subfamily serine protease